ncbi:MAG: DUF192 domain-containing protein [Planctomycetota bacterium]|jgi:uncharacterized membrane protein (UPF0127 family)
MKRLLGIALALWLAVASLAASVIGVLPPRYRLARDVAVLWHSSRQVERISEPGTYTLEFPCGHAHGEHEGMTIEVTRPQAAEQGGDAYLECAPGEARRYVEEGADKRLSFSDTVVTVRAPGSTAPAVLADGRALALGSVLGTEGGVKCLLPAHDPALAQTVSAVGPGDMLTIRGRPVFLRGSEPCLLVDWAQLTSGSGLADEPPWTVALRWDGREAAAFSQTGSYSVRLSCLHRKGAVEGVSVRLREFKVVDLEVDGHPVVAELADTPDKLSWGLQGHPGLKPNEGMLFFFERPLRPVFAMKAVSFPISIAFVRTDGVIVNIEKLAPGDLRTVTSPVPVAHVLEMTQGWFEEHGVAPGKEVVIP